MESWPGLTEIPSSETCELFWAIFAFTTLFSSWNIVLQRNFFSLLSAQNELSQRAFTSKFFIICSCQIKVWYGSISSQKNYLNFFFRKRHLNVLKNVLFPKIYFERDIIPTKVWFLSGICWLANNLTGQADVRLCKLGGGWWLVKWMYQELFFFLSSQRSKEAKIIITPDLRLLPDHPPLLVWYTKLEVLFLSWWEQ